MVLEGVVASVLNSVLSEFIENVDPKQLQLSVATGRLELEHLRMKDTAFDRFGLPLRLRFGSIGRLALIVPSWLQPFSKPWRAELDQLFCLVVPSMSVEYNEKEEVRIALERKLAEINRLELALADGDQGKEAEGSSSGFVEKIIAHFLRTLQVSIRSVHVRYEDSITLPSPFSAGVTIHSLELGSRGLTGSSSWKEDDAADEALQKRADRHAVPRSLDLNALALYANVQDSRLIGALAADNVRAALEASIAGDRPVSTSEKAALDVSQFSYIVAPITLKTGLQIDPKPNRTSFLNPMVDAVVELARIQLTLTKAQYDSLYVIAHEVNRQVVQSMYRRYRPKGFEKLGGLEKFRYASTVVLESVRKRLKAWRWKHIKAHRQSCRAYQQLYARQLAKRPLSADEMERLEQLERELDLFNLMLCRQQSQSATARMIEEDKKSSSKGKGGWGNWIWRAGKKKPEPPSAMQEAAAQITAEDKEKIARAIDFQESDVDVKWPSDYEKFCLHVRLTQFSLVLLDARRQVAALQCNEFNLACSFRPSNSGVTVQTSLHSIQIDGCTDLPSAVATPAAKASHSPHEPACILSTWSCASALRRETSQGSLVSYASLEARDTSSARPPLDTQSSPSRTRENCVFFAQFIWKPPTASTTPPPSLPPNTYAWNSSPTDAVDLVVRLEAHPLELVLHQATVNALRIWSQPPRTGRTAKHIARMIRSRMNEARAMTTTGLKHLLNKRLRTQIDVRLEPSRILVPERGDLQRARTALVIGTGQFSISNRNLYTSEKLDQLNEYDLLRSESYMCYGVQLRNAYAYYSSNIEAILAADQRVGPRLDVDNALLLPLTVHLVVGHTPVQNDFRFPKVVLNGELRDFRIEVSDTLLNNTMTLLNSIPPLSMPDSDTGLKEGPLASASATLETVREDAEHDSEPESEGIAARLDSPTQIQNVILQLQKPPPKSADDKSQAATGEKKSDSKAEGPSEEEDRELIALLGLFECAFRVAEFNFVLCERQFALAAPDEPRPMVTHVNRVEVRALDLEAKVLVRTFDTRVVAALRSLAFGTQYSVADSPVPERYPFLESQVPDAADKQTLALTDEFAAFIGAHTLPLLHFTASALLTQYEVELTDAGLETVRQPSLQSAQTPSPPPSAAATAVPLTTADAGGGAEAKKKARLFWVDVRILDRLSPLYTRPEFKQSQVCINAICQELAMHLHQEASNQLIHFCMHKLAPIFQTLIIPAAAAERRSSPSTSVSRVPSTRTGSITPDDANSRASVQVPTTAAAAAGGGREQPKRRLSSIVDAVKSVRRLSSTSAAPKPKLELKPLLGKGHYAMRLSAQVQSLSIQIANQQSGALAKFAVRRIGAAVAVADFLTEFSLQLSNISLTELAEAALYKQILAIDAGSVKQADYFFDLHVLINEREKLLSPSQRKQILRKEMPKEQLLAVALARDLDFHDVDLKLDINRVNLIYTQRFINGSLKMLMSTFEALNTESVRATIHETNAQLYGAARQSLSSFREQEFRLGMDVNIKAPFVFVPSEPASTHGLGLDMGSIAIRNHLEFAPKEPSVHVVAHKKLALLADSSSTTSNASPVPTNNASGSALVSGAFAHAGGESFPKLDVMEVTLSNFRINRMSVFLPPPSREDAQPSAEVILSVRPSLSAGDNTQKPELLTTKPISRYLVEPVTVSVALRRNLCASWFHGVPDLHLRVHLPTLALSASSSDLALIMHTVLYNLDVLNELFPPSASAPRPRPPAATAPMQAQTPAPAETEEQVVMRNKETATGVQLLALELNIGVVSGEIVIDTLDPYGFNTLEPQTFADACERRVKLTKAALTQLDVSFSMQDRTMYGVVMLESLDLVDKRGFLSEATTSPAADDQIRHLIRPIDASAPARETDARELTGDMSLSTTFRPSGPGLQKLGRRGAILVCEFFMDRSTPTSNLMITDVTVNGLSICLSIPYLLALLDFVTKGLASYRSSAQLSSRSDSVFRSVDLDGIASGRIDVADEAVEEEKAIDVVKAQADFKKVSMEVRVKLSESEVLMPESVLSRHDAQAIILSSRASVVFRTYAEPVGGMMLQANVDELQLFSASYLQSARANSMNRLLKSCSLRTSLVWPSATSAAVGELVADGFVFHMNPAHVQLATRVASFLMNSLQEVSASIATQLDAEDEPSGDDIWNPHAITKYHCPSWYLRNRPQRDATSVSSSEINSREFARQLVAGLRSKNDRLRLVVGAISFNLEQSSGESSIPLLLLRAGVEGEVRNWSANLEVRLELTALIDTYNLDQERFEPLLERADDASGMLHYKPWGFALQVKKPSIIDVDPELLEPDPESGQIEDYVSVTATVPRLTVSIEASDHLNLSISKTNLDTLQKISALLSEAMDVTGANKKIAERATDAKLGDFYTVVNDTDSALKVTLCDRETRDRAAAAPASIRWTRIADDASARVQIVGVRRRALCESGQQHTFSLSNRDTLASYLVYEQHALQQLGVRFSLRQLGQQTAGAAAEEFTEAVWIEVGEPGTTAYTWRVGAYELRFVCVLESRKGVKLLTLRSTLRFENRLPTPVQLFARVSPKQQPAVLLTIPPADFNHPVRSLPLWFASNPNAELFIRTEASATDNEGNKYLRSEQPISIKELTRGLAKPPMELFCRNRSDPNADKSDSTTIGAFSLLTSESEDHLPHDVTPAAAPSSKADKFTKLELPITCSTLMLSPTVILHNELPYDVDYMVRGAESIDCYEQWVLIPGQPAAILYMGAKPKESIRFILREYLNKEWQAEWYIPKNLVPSAEPPAQPVVLKFLSKKEAAHATMFLNLQVHKRLDGVLYLKLFASYWIVNRLGMPLGFQLSTPNADDVSFRQFATSDIRKPFLLCYQNAPQSSSQRVMQVAVCFAPGQRTLLSKKFAIDAMGTSGALSCVVHEGPMCDYEYHFGVYIQGASGSASLDTRIITFMPYFILVNQTRNTLVVKECGSSQKPVTVEIAPNDSQPYWPSEALFKRLLRPNLKVAVKEEKPTFTDPFIIDEPHMTLLKLPQPHCGIHVDVQTNDAATIIYLQNYQPGMAAALIINDTPLPLCCFQKGAKTMRKTLLEPLQQVLYTWDDALHPNKDRAVQLFVNTGGPLGAPLVESRLDTETAAGQATAKMGKSEMTIYHTCLLEGVQRVLLLTDSQPQLRALKRASAFEHPDLKLELNVSSVGVSLVNNLTRAEILYAQIFSPGVTWFEARVKKPRAPVKNFRPVKLKFATELEERFQRRLNGELLPAEFRLSDGVHLADVELFKFLKPKEKTLYRNDRPGVSLKLTQRPHTLEVEGAIASVQVDYQLADGAYQNIVTPVQLEPSVARDFRPQPFVSFSLVKERSNKSQVQIIRYLQGLVQEFYLKVDRLLVTSLAELFSAFLVAQSGAVNSIADAILIESEFQPNLVFVDKTFMEMCTELHASAGTQGHYFGLLHLSPLKIHLFWNNYASIQQQASAADAPSAGPAPPAAAATPAVTGGAQRTTGGSSARRSAAVAGLRYVAFVPDTQDSVLQLAYFERRNQFCNRDRLIREIAWQYTSQALRQVLFLVGGLDVLGNPAGVVRSFATGVETFFYEPYKGAVQGPSEFLEGVSIGVSSLIGHAVGGATGAVSRVASSLGKAAAALSLNADYQRKRRLAMKQAAQGGTMHAFSVSAKGLVSNIGQGLVGVLVQPARGAKQGGLSGFAKGFARGIAGAVMMPVGGVVDGAGNVFSSLNRAAASSGVMPRVRLPRYLPLDLTVRPFSLREATGATSFADLRTRSVKLADDEYVMHWTLLGEAKGSKNAVSSLLLTNRHLCFLLGSDKWVLANSPPTEHVAQLDATRIAIDTNALTTRNEFVLLVGHASSREPYRLCFLSQFELEHALRTIAAVLALNLQSRQIRY